MTTKEDLEKFADFRDGDRVWLFTEREENGKDVIIRRNFGFSAIELLGLAGFATQEVLCQIRGEFKPDVIQREILEDGEEKE
jgi:hypothetical protein